MLGYVVPEKPELKIKEFEIYNAYYCGICKSIGRRYGQLERFVLNYDSVFLALILAGISKHEEQIKTQRCLVNPLKKKNIIYDSIAVDYAADLMLILAYHKMKDDYFDEKKLSAAFFSLLMKNTYRKLSTFRKEQCTRAQEHMRALMILEKDKTDAIDPAAEPFAKLMEEVFDGFLEKDDKMQEKRCACKKIGYHLGKWIYLIDAYDDIEDNIESGAYNPLIYQFHFEDGDSKKVAEFKTNIRERVEFNLMRYLAEIAQAYESLNIEKNSSLLENIIYFGLHKKTQEVLFKEKGTRSEQKNAEEKEREKNNAESI